MKPIPFFDLKEQNRNLEPDLQAAFRRVVTKADFILGPEVQNFEERFAQFTGTRFAVGVSSGLDALFLALKALGIGPGHEVIVPANSFIATALAVSSTGARPVFADAEPERLLIDPASMKKAVTRRTKAVIPVHLYGQPAAMEEIGRFCRRKGLSLVEDACQAHGASIGKKRCGSFGDLGCFSFYPGKNLGAFGDGGIVVTDNRSFYQKLLLLRNYGSTVKYKHLVAGYNMRLDALQAAILNVKLDYLSEWNRKRQILARRYDDRLKDTPGIRLLKREEDCVSAHHLYVVRVERRRAFQEFLSARGIGTGIHYPTPIHRQGAYRCLGKNPVSLAVSEKESKKVVSLPLYPEMSAGDVDVVSDAIKEFLGKK